MILRLRACRGQNPKSELSRRFLLPNHRGPILTDEQLRDVIASAIATLVQQNRPIRYLDVISLGAKGSRQRVNSAINWLTEHGHLDPKHTIKRRGPREPRGTYKRRGPREPRGTYKHQVHNVSPPGPPGKKPHRRVVSLKTICRQWIKEYDQAWCRIYALRFTNSFQRREHERNH